MASVDMCEHDWPGSGCPDCRLRRHVFEALDHCKANGYDELLADTPERIAFDMLAYDAGLEDEDGTPEEMVARLKPHIEAWKKEHGL